MNPLLNGAMKALGTNQVIRLVGQRVARSMPVQGRSQVSGHLRMQSTNQGLRTMTSKATSSKLHSVSSKSASRASVAVSKHLHSGTMCEMNSFISSQHPRFMNVNLGPKTDTATHAPRFSYCTSFASSKPFIFAVIRV